MTAPTDGLVERLCGHLRGYDAMADAPNRSDYWFVHPDEIREVLKRLQAVEAERDEAVRALNEKVQHHIDVHSDCPPKSHAAPRWMYRDQGDHP